jgi:hypothetical protein
MLRRRHCMLYRGPTPAAALTPLHAARCTVGATAAALLPPHAAPSSLHAAPPPLHAALSKPHDAASPLPLHYCRCTLRRRHCALRALLPLQAAPSPLHAAPSPLRCTLRRRRRTLHYCR